MHVMSDEELIQMLQQQFLLRNHKVEDLQQIALELEVVNRRLRESEALKGQFLSNIRNEINNPLAVIIGAAFNCMQASDPAQLQPLAQLIYKESQLLSFQLENIFAAAEMEAGDDRPSLTQVNIKSVINSQIDSFHLMAQEKELEINLSPQDDDLPFCTDEAKLKLVIANLIHNAIKFSGPRQTITISLHSTPSHLQLCVQDQGIGIAHDHFDYIFDRFRQIDEGRCKEYQGHGLGLAVVKAILDQLGGSITLKSAPGKGSAFIIQLPQASETTIIQDLGFDGNEVFFDDEDGIAERF
jgi:signal transduction histidine kinase